MASYSGDGIRTVNEDGPGRLVRALLVAAAAAAVVTAVLVGVVRRTPSVAPPGQAAGSRVVAAPPAPAPAGPGARAPREIDPHAEPVVRAVDRLRARRRAAAAARD